MESRNGFEIREDIDSRNERIRAKLLQRMLPVLPFELVILEQKLETIKREQDELGAELSVVNHQSSETWHDNFAANEVERYSKVVHRKGSNLVDALSRTVRFDYPPEGDKITLGSLFEVRFGDLDAVETAMLTGTSREIGEVEELGLAEDTVFITLQSPVGSALLDSSPGEVVRYEVGGKPREAHVLSVRQLSL